MPTGNTLRYVRYLDDFPWRSANESSGTDTVEQSVTPTKDLCRADQHQGHRALHADVHRPGRPRARSNVRFRHDRLCRGAVGAALDHDRHVTRRARARTPATHGREFPSTCSPTRIEGHAKEQAARPPACLPRQQFASDIRHGFVYERVQHITLKSIANNPDIKEGMTRERDRRRDQAARRLRAPLRQALRGPEEGPGRGTVHGRVAQPAPGARRSQDWEEPVSRDRRLPRTPTRRTSSSRSSTTSPRPASRTARKAERIKFAAFETYAGSYIQAIGEQIPTRRSRQAVADRHRDRPAVRHGERVVREERGQGGDPGRGRRPALHPRLRLRPQRHQRH